MNHQRADAASFSFRSRAWEGHIVKFRDCLRLLNERGLSDVVSRFSL
jgi:hypothetical protein